MHSHKEAQGADWDYVFKLWLAHGITTVRFKQKKRVST